MPSPVHAPILIAANTSPTSTVVPTTVYSPVITINGNNIPNSVIGPKNDSSDFFGLGIALAAIVLTIVVVRVAFRGRGTQAHGPR